MSEKYSTREGSRVSAIEPLYLTNAAEPTLPMGALGTVVENTNMPAYCVKWLRS